MHFSISDINSFIEKQVGVNIEEIKPETDIHSELGVSGDDFDEMISEYSKKFNVDLTNYLWYFHCDEEGGWNSIGGSFIKPPNERVARIPVTPNMLLNYANTGKWGLEYPEHKLPKYRYDMWINGVLVLSVLGYLIFSLIKWLS